MATQRTRKKKAEPGSRGLRALDLRKGADDAATRVLAKQIEDAGGAVLAVYREPFGGMSMTLAALPIETVAPTPFQRDVSEPHAKRLAEAIEQVGAFLDPIIAVPTERGEGKVRFWSPNGYHRLTALGQLGARSITALVSPDERLAYRILALNTEKAHNVKERCLEAVRMARGLADLDPKAKETLYEVELQDASLVTLGIAYEERPRFAGGAYAPAFKASEAFLDQPIAHALAVRTERAHRLLAIDDRVSEIVSMLKERGFESPYLRYFVVARIRPFRPRGKAAPAIDELIEHMEQAAGKFDVARVKREDLAKTAGAPEE